MNIIRYDEIMNMLSRFESLKDDNQSGSDTVRKGFSTFSSSGINIGETGYGSAISNQLSKLTKNSEICQSDYDRIIRFLRKLAQVANQEADKAISTVQAREVWNATETVDG